MKTEKRVYKSFAMLYPAEFKKDIQEMIDYTRRRYTADSYLGACMIFSILVFIAVLLLPWSIFQQFDYWYIGYGAIVFILIQFVNYLLLYYEVEGRTKQIEEALPDMLQLIAANLKAGMTFFQAIKSSARDEFGPLKEEIEIALNKVDVFSEISRRVHSGVFDRVVKLLGSAIKSGGNTANVLEELSKDMYETRNLRKELMRNSKTYILFILFTALIGTPILLAISIHFLSSIAALETMQSFEGEKLIEVSISSDFMTNISLAMLIITSVLVCVLIGTIKEGNLKAGLKYSPLMIIGTLLIFYFAKFGIAWFF